MPVFRLYFFLLFLISSAAQVVSAQQKAQPKNIIFILSDDHRYDYMGFMKKIPWLETPYMDQMAQQGAHMKNAFVTTSLCSPSRATILTGLLAHSHKVIDNFSPLPKGLVFFPQLLQKAGYQTAFFGKFHMGEEKDDPEPGFNYWESFAGQGVYFDFTLNTNGKRKEYKEGYITDVLTDHAISWMQKRDPNKPFMLYLSHKGVHHPFEPAPRHKGSYANKPVTYPPSFNTPAYTDISRLPTKSRDSANPKAHRDYYGKDYMPDWLKQQRESWHGVDYMFNGTYKYEDLIRNYCETLRSIDESIGKVMQYLKDNHLDKNTVVFYMGDNGFTLGEHGIIDKRQFYEESGRVPLLVWAPGMIQPNTVVQQMVLNLDLAPTMLNIAGVKVPSNMQGQSFLPLLKGQKTVWRNKIFYEYYWEQDYPQTPTTFGVRDSRYKYIRYHGIWDTDEFYDLEKDPNEMHNLIDSPEHQERISLFVKDLFDWLEKTDGLSIPLKRNLGKKRDHRNEGLY